MTAAAAAVAAAYEAVSGEQWDRTGRRSDGATFTVDTFARYHLHDLVHHAHDVSHITKRVTVASYEADAEAYAAGQPPVSGEVAAAVEGFAGLLENGARVLEVGSGSGRDATAARGAWPVGPPYRHHPGLRPPAPGRGPRGDRPRPAGRRPRRSRARGAVRRGLGLGQPAPRAS